MLCTALLALSSGAAYALNTIKDVRTGQQNDGIRIVLDGTEDFDYDAFLLDSPNRLVIDLKNATVSGSPKVAKNRLISDFRVGNKPDIKGKRLVFDINNNVNIKRNLRLSRRRGRKLAAGYRPQLAGAVRPVAEIQPEKCLQRRGQAQENRRARPRTRGQRPRRYRAFVPHL